MGGDALPRNMRFCVRDRSINHLFCRGCTKMQKFRNYPSTSPSLHTGESSVPAPVNPAGFHSASLTSNRKLPPRVTTNHRELLTPRIRSNPGKRVGFVRARTSSRIQKSLCTHHRPRLRIHTSTKITTLHRNTELFLAKHGTIWFTGFRRCIN
jgi:hypothetical protein